MLTKEFLPGLEAQKRWGGVVLHPEQKASGTLRRLFDV